MDELRFRQIHLDFHTSEQLNAIGSKFDPEQFAETLARAHVNSVTLFARCHHGMIYYDSKINPELVHPGLVDKNLLAEQIRACRARGIRTPIYTTVQWDYHMSQHHPEWVARDASGCAVGEPPARQQPILEPGFYASLCVTSPYRDFLKAHVREIITEFHPVDGLFLDIVFPVDCHCRYCREQMESEGLELHNDEQRKRFAQLSINRFKADMTAFIRSLDKDCTIFYNRGHVGTAHRDALDAYSHLELESLPSGLWGYLHFPATIRYARTLGKDCLSQTGKFHTMWGDFHSFKNQAALEFECFHMLAMNAKCLIGDQLNPDGELSPAVYDLVGKVYAQIEQKEPWCSRAVARTEIGVLTPEEFAGASADNLPNPLRGAVRMLQESALQFDILDSRSDFGLYRLLILPDVIPVNRELQAKLQRYVDQGGKIIASFQSGLDPAGSQFASDLFGVTLRPSQAADLYGKPVAGRIYERANYAEYLLPTGEIGRGLPATEHVMYIHGLAVDALPDSEVLADNIASVFDRTYQHFCSHRQSPSSGQKFADAIVRRGPVIYFSHPVFLQYNNNAPRWCKTLLVNAIDLLLGRRILRHTGPSSMITAVNRQAGLNRDVVHLLHYIPERRSETIDVIEDIIPLYQIGLTVETDRPVQAVTAEPSGQALAWTCGEDGLLQVTVPEIHGHQMVSIQY